MNKRRALSTSPSTKKIKLSGYKRTPLTSIADTSAGSKLSLPTKTAKKEPAYTAAGAIAPAYVQDDGKSSSEERNPASPGWCTSFQLYVRNGGITGFLSDPAAPCRSNGYVQNEGGSGLHWTSHPSTCRCRGKQPQNRDRRWFTHR